MNSLRATTCCFTGYRAEKMPFSADHLSAMSTLSAALEQAITRCAQRGITRFFTGMSTGFDLWAAEAVLRMREQLPVQLLCAIPFDQQADRYSPTWKRIYNRCLLSADWVHSLSHRYHAGCYAARNRFMVDNSSFVICYFDGKPGGTAQTLRMARQQGLEILNLADPQLTLPDLS